MSDDLVKRLRQSWEVDRSIISQTGQWMTERKEAADLIEELEAENAILRTEKHADAEALGSLEAKLAKAMEAGVGVAASLNAAISLLERGGKKAAASDKMFAQMLLDYNASLDRFRATLAELKGGEA